jgi:predicted small secreted protein
MIKTLLAILAALFVLAGCNTIEGMGKDISKAKPSPCTRGWSPRWTGRTSTPTPSSPSSS